MWNFAVAVYALSLSVFIWLVARKHGTLINPVTYFGCHFGLQTLVAPAAMHSIGLLDFTWFRAGDLTATMSLSGVFFGCICVPFLMQQSPLQPLLERCTPKTVPSLRPTTLILTLAVVAAMFAMLMQSSGAGMLWFSNPRAAYQTCRQGAGLWWSLSEASLLVSFVCVLFRKKRSLASVLLACGSFAVMAYFLGSKGFILNYMVLSVFYLEHHARKISRKMLAFIGLIVVAGVAFLQVAQGTASTLMDTLMYFDYFPNTARFVSDFGTLFSHSWGTTWASNLWLYVPRALYPSKPLIYGAASIMDVYYPGAAEASGATPGVLNWADGYLDFGLIGVLAEGLFTGLVAKASFDMFRSRPNVWTMLLLGQVGLINGEMTFYHAPFPIFLLWMCLQWFLLKLASIPLIKQASCTANPRISPRLLLRDGGEQCAFSLMPYNHSRPSLR